MVEASGKEDGEEIEKLKEENDNLKKEVGNQGFSLQNKELLEKLENLENQPENNSNQGAEGGESGGEGQEEKKEEGGDENLDHDENEDHDSDDDPTHTDSDSVRSHQPNFSGRRRLY